jgi:hypothetical protein
MTEQKVGIPSHENDAGWQKRGGRPVQGSAGQVAGCGTVIALALALLAMVVVVL